MTSGRLHRVLGTAHRRARLGVGRPGDLRRAPARVGLSRPGRMLALAVLWQRLNFLPLPHQHGSLALSTPWPRVERSVTSTGYRRIGATMGPCLPLEPLPAGARRGRRARAPVPMRLAAAAPQPRRAPGRSATCCSCTCGPTRPTGGPSAWPSPSPTYSPGVHRRALAWSCATTSSRARPAGPIGDAVALGPHLDAVRGHPMARAALELAVLDAQLRAADRSLAAWLGATATAVPAGAALGLHDDVDDLLAEADARARRRAPSACG